MDLQTHSRPRILTLLPDDWLDQYVSLLSNHLVGLGVRHWSQMLVQGKGQSKAHIYMWVPHQSLSRLTPDVVFECSPRGPTLTPPLLLTSDTILTFILCLVSVHKVQGHMTNRKWPLYTYLNNCGGQIDRRRGALRMITGFKSKRLSCETISGGNIGWIKSHFYFIKNTKISNASFFSL